MVLVFLTSKSGELTRLEKETLSLGRQIADSRGIDLAASCTTNFPKDTFKFGINKAIELSGVPSHVDSQSYASVISALAERDGAQFVLIPHDSTGKSILGRVAIRLGGRAVSDVTTYDVDQDCAVRSSYSGKANTSVPKSGGAICLGVSGDGTIKVEESTEIEIEVFDFQGTAPKTFFVQSVLQDADISLPEASRVVSAGRGMKSPDNWGLIEELAKEIGAATACSRPVADSEWRPHHEHVGQTGLSIRPQLYMAFGISGAIQHLAGVNSSKTIVVVNTDPEAPFFKAADYGVVGDLFEVIPKLLLALRNS